LFELLFLLLLLSIFFLDLLEVFLKLLVFHLACGCELFVVNIVSIIKNICILLHRVAVFDGNCLLINLLLDELLHPHLVFVGWLASLF
jgi:hypothetical protein